MIEPAVRSLLADAPAVKQLAGDRITFATRPQDERRPCIVLSLVDETQDQTFEGPSELFQGRLQLDCWAPTYQQAKALAKAARQAINGYSGTVADCAIDYIETDTGRDIPVMPQEGRATPALYGVSIDALFQYQE